MSPLVEVTRYRQARVQVVPSIMSPTNGVGASLRKLLVMLILNNSQTSHEIGVHSSLQRNHA